MKLVTTFLIFCCSYACAESSEKALEVCHILDFKTMIEIGSMTKEQSPEIQKSTEKTEFSIAQTEEKMARVLESNFTAEELQSIIDWHNTKAGKKFMDLILARSPCEAVLTRPIQDRLTYFIQQKKITK